MAAKRGSMFPNLLLTATPLVLSRKARETKREIQTKDLHKYYKMYASIPQPCNYEEAMLDQHTNIDKLG